jgi:Na+/H+ antiporter NhaD/arsenite permease-like protein
MSVMTFLLLLVIAAIAAGAQIVIGGSPPELRGRSFGALFVAYALLLVLPVLLPSLLGG